MFSALTLSDVKARCPSAFADRPRGDMKPSYSFVPTARLIEGLMERGWTPTDARQDRVRRVDNAGFQRHMIRFSRTSDIGRDMPHKFELVMLNSHNASTTYRLNAGVIRIACFNGIIVSDRTVAAVRLTHHHHLDLDRVIEGSYRLLDTAPEVFGQIESMQETQVHADDRLCFARKALQLRYPDITKAPVKPVELLASRRDCDVRNDCWTTFNRVQENLLKGGIRGSVIRENGKRAGMLRGIRALDTSAAINTRLWDLALAMRDGTLSAVPSCVPEPAALSLS